MKFKVILGLLFLSLSLGVSAQQPEPQNTTPKNVSDNNAKKDVDSKSTDSTYIRPDAKTRRKNYFNSMFGPYALARTVVGAGYGTWRNSPEEWGGQWEGFGRRVASGVGKNVVKQTTIYALDESLKLDSKFYRSRKRSFGAKVKNALISPFTARTEDGKRVFGLPRVVGTYTSSVIAYETWYPRRYDFKDGLRSGTISLGFNAAFNLFKEFVKK
ncbi:MAG TPA: hypothetical protein VIL74_24940 [Pyrinomonadaceae bacterium]|jgi:hypothetical protein